MEVDYEPDIVVGDFNFDGHEDFALLTCDHCGPYGVASHSVFLFAPESKTFARSRELSRLAESSIVPMRADAARKRLIIASKSGCCIHWTEEHEVRGGIPRLMKRELEEVTADGACVSTSETRREDGRMQREKRPCAGGAGSVP
ncbi:Hypothetical protein A7982_05974 [Minicystis rosea]|nr:Hypothetical protein A7982_05974 [Minicystis rosea]